MMNSNLNEIYSDEYQSENETIKLVCQLNENEKLKNENVNNLEDLLIKSRQLNSSESIRLINENLEYLSINKKKSIKNLILSCNQFGLTNNINWTHLPKNLQSIDLSGNFLSSIDGIEKENNELESLALSFNQINQLSHIFSRINWPNLCLLDLSYNNLDNLKETIDLLKNLSKLRIIYLHGNPLSLLVDYRIYVIDSLEKLLVLDDIRITAEERIRSRNYSRIARKDKDYSSFQISFKNIDNVPPAIPNQNEWPLQVHRYKMSLDWFQGEKQDIEINLDSMSNFKRFNKTQIESSFSDYKINIEFLPLSFNLTNDQLIHFRDFLFNGTKCRFIHQLTEYWPPESSNTQGNDSQKNKSNASRDKKNETPVKKKKIEDLSKLIIRTDPIETILAEFNIDLRSFLDGDYQVLFQYKSVLEQQKQYFLSQQENIEVKSGKQKDSSDKNDSNKDKKRASPFKLPQDKLRDQQKDKKNINENDNESDKIDLIQPFQCSIQFQLQRFVTQEQII
ncbi:unnamed protein product [Rotaria magnacalcarata]|uniref:Uncharacterized protein n=1 Tax=Rotaria magnacalcarata TaxID=392030 RepID=A0A815WPP8_9BILA|nr:unnamed protein product [Rotaria magnacalcarata]CAF1544557.1 unnamed protein product [Rotaria magnacalcarata]CAF2073430.1 unnamed protein product [Rotaria magnacalcarata]CAF2074171.1 unnamed protein product [Rotaria magnacalcarata]CAF3782441.1 unnamed protein product [Rotaria magnacalcarata]